MLKSKTKLARVFWTRKLEEARAEANSKQERQKSEGGGDVRRWLVTDGLVASERYQRLHNWTDGRVGRPRAKGGG